MARMPRLVVPGYRLYIALISESAREAETEIWAHCLMPNHGPLVMVPSTEDGLVTVKPMLDGVSDWSAYLSST